MTNCLVVSALSHVFLRMSLVVGFRLSLDPLSYAAPSTDHLFHSESILKT